MYGSVLKEHNLQLYVHIWSGNVLCGVVFDIANAGTLTEMRENALLDLILSLFCIIFIEKLQILR